MFHIHRRRLEWQLLSMGTEAERFYIHEGTITFESDDESLDGGYTQISFSFSPGAILHTPEGAKRVDVILVDLRSKEIQMWDKESYEWITLGIMEEFKTEEEALRILEKFIESHTVKETPRCEGA